MIYLVDTGVLLRLFNRADASHSIIRQCIRELKRSGHRIAISTQNVAEFWNVSTRPESARGGYGMTVEHTDRRVKILEKFCEVLPDSKDLYAAWRRLVVKYQVKGVQVHDARLVAWMETQAISQIISLNVEDFKRYEGVSVLTPNAALREVTGPSAGEIGKS
jgi:predicted nucleic acid-binding protein